MVRFRERMDFIVITLEYAETLRLDVPALLRSEGHHTIYVQLTTRSLAKYESHCERWKSSHRRAELDVYVANKGVHFLSDNSIPCR